MNEKNNIRILIIESRLRNIVRESLEMYYNCNWKMSNGNNENFLLQLVDFDDWDLIDFFNIVRFKIK